MSVVESEETGVRRVRAAMAGDLDAFAEIVRRERDRLVMTAHGILRDYHEAEDVAQDALVTAFHRLETLREATAFRTWLFTILVRLATRRRARATRRILGLTEVSDRREGADPRLDRLVEEMERLPEKYRLLLSLHHLAGLDYEAVATVTGLSPKRIKSRLYEARRTLRRRLGDDDA